MSPAGLRSQNVGHRMQISGPRLHVLGGRLLNWNVGKQRRFLPLSPSPPLPLTDPGHRHQVTERFVLPEACEDRPREAGFTLVMLVMVIAVMSIMMGVAVQAVSFQMQREREAELIFRGRQYVEAIRIFKAKYGRNPMRMKEIWEADPKVIRQKWKDPITNSENWGIIFMGQERQVGRPGVGLGEGTPLPTGTPGFGTGGRDDRQEGDGLPDGVHRNEEGEIIGPIVGVHSTSCDESIKIYEGRTTYCEWRFFIKPDQQQGRRPGGGGSGGGPGGGSAGGYHAGDDKPVSEQTPQPYPTGTPRARP